MKVFNKTKKGKLAFTKFVPLTSQLGKRKVGNFEKVGETNYNTDLLLYVNGQKRVVNKHKFGPDTLLIDFLRKELHLTGTKLTCGEGGCGACTVMVSQYNKEKKEVINKSINSCLVPLYQCHGTQVTTTEGIGKTKLTKKGDQNELHPVQAKLVENFGSQCGFCTPGFVMAIYTTLRNNPKASLEDLEKSIDGNLCRCTGYRPIVQSLKELSENYKCPQLKDSEKFADELKHNNLLESPLYTEKEGKKWFMPLTLNQLADLKAKFPEAKLVSGNTEIGIEQRFGKKDYPILISPLKVPELNVLNTSKKEIEIGASVPLTDLWKYLEKLSLSQPNSSDGKENALQRRLRAIIDQLRWFSGTSIRNAAGLGGNIVTASPISDLNPVWMATDTSFVLYSSKRGKSEVLASDFFLGYRKVALEADEVLVSIKVPIPNQLEFIESYKQSKRREDDIAIVTCCFNLEFEREGNTKIKKARLAFGGVAAVTKRAKETEAFLQSASLFNQATFEQALDILAKELHIPQGAPGGKEEYRTTLALSLFYKFYLSSLHQFNFPSEEDIPQFESARKFKLSLKDHHLFSSTQTHNFTPTNAIGVNAVHLSGNKQVCGEATYIDDLPPFQNELYGALVTSSLPHAEILSVDASQALKFPSVKGFFSHKDVPGYNRIGDIIQDEFLFAEKTVTRVGQVIGIVVAESEQEARQAAASVKVSYKELPSILTLEDAIQKESYFPQEHKIVRGDVEKVFNSKESNVKFVVEGEMKIGGQEHFYFEPHSQLVIPLDKEITVFSSTQNVNKTQAFVAKVLNMPSHSVVAKVKRIGGGFGGKETDNIFLSCAAAVAAHHTNRPVRLVLERDEDIKWTGKRHPFYGKYKLAADENGKFVGAKISLRSNGGNWHDLSWPVMDRAIFHSDNSYLFPNMEVSGRVCQTNTFSNTAFRGFGGPQGVIICESAIEHLADEMGVRPEKLRAANLYKSEDKTHYGQTVNARLPLLWEECVATSKFEDRVKEIETFNQRNYYRKKGISVVPAKFGLSFTFTTLNQGSALVHLHTDGTLLVNHGGMEMGQGLHTKIAQIASQVLGIPLKDIHVSDTSTDKVANASATAASMGTDINGQAVYEACLKLKERLAPIIEKMPKGTKMSEIANQAYLERVDLSERAFFRVPVEGFNFETGKGTPFCYFTTGVACTEVEIDTLTGDHRINRSDIVMDVGNSINPAIDIGQIEGAFVQGAGWLTTEELIWGDNKDFKWIKPGNVFTAGPGNYKIPASDDIPLQFNVTLMKDAEDPKLRSKAIFSSRGVGEPPIVLSSSVFFAIKDAVRSARKQRGVKGPFYVDAPFTGEKIRMLCPDKFSKIVFSNYKNQNAQDLYLHFKAKGCF